MTAAVRRWLPPGTDGQLYALLDLADLVTGRLRWTTGLGTVECLGPLPADRSLVPSGLNAVVRTRGEDLERESHLVRDARLAREIGRDDIAQQRREFTRREIVELFSHVLKTPLEGGRLCAAPRF